MFGGSNILQTQINTFFALFTNLLKIKMHNIKLIKKLICHFILRPNSR